MTVLNMSAHHYLFDVVTLLDDCIDKLQLTIDEDVRGEHDALYEMKTIFVSTERLLHRYLLQVLQSETSNVHADIVPLIDADATRNLSSTMQTLKSVLDEKQKRRAIQNRNIRFRNPQEPQPSTFYPARSATDTLLFRLLVDLQLCLVRIDDAHFVITGKRLGRGHIVQSIRLPIALFGSALGFGATVILSRRNHLRFILLRDVQSLALASAKFGAALLAFHLAGKAWNKLWMTDKIVRSTEDIARWQKQWQLVLSTSSSGENHESHSSRENSGELTPEPKMLRRYPELLDKKSQRLIEFAMKESPKVSVTRLFPDECPYYLD